MFSTGHSSDRCYCVGRVIMALSPGAMLARDKIDPHMECNYSSTLHPNADSAEPAWMVDVPWPR